MQRGCIFDASSKVALLESRVLCGSVLQDPNSVVLEEALLWLTLVVGLQRRPAVRQQRAAYYQQTSRLQRRASTVPHHRAAGSVECVAVLVTVKQRWVTHGCGAGVRSR